MTNNPDAAASVKLTSSGHERQDTNLVLEKLLVAEEHPFKIQDMTYCENFDMLSVGLSNGQIVNYTLEIESFVYTGDKPISNKSNQKLN